MQFHGFPFVDIENASAINAMTPAITPMTSAKNMSVNVWYMNDMLLTYRHMQAVLS